MDRTKLEALFKKLDKDNNGHLDHDEVYFNAILFLIIKTIKKLFN